MSDQEAKEIWDGFSEEQRTLIETELTLVYTEVLNDFINENRGTPSETTSDRLRSSIDGPTKDSQSRESRNAVRAA